MATNTRTARRQKKQKQKKPLWKNIMKAILLAIVACAVVIGGIFIYFIATAPKLDPEKLDVPYSTQFYDKEGNQFADKGEENRIKINYDDVPQELIDAVTATEDVRFFKHKGIDMRRIAGAVKANIQRGFGAEGASTITQQVVEQMFLTPDKSLKIKVQEQWLALKLEREYTKEEIMEMYLNKIFYGSNAYGVAKAAEVYFDKEDLHDLTLLESAMLAGLPQRPTAYNPFENPEYMQDRVDTVLKLMVRHGKITQEEADEARDTEVSSVLTDKKPAASPHFTFLQKVEDELEEKLDGVNVNSAGLKVYTTLDTKAQEQVELLLSDAEDNPIAYPDDEMQAGMTVLDTKTGEIRAIGGGRDRQTGDLNYAFKAPRQPGSIFKPLLAYGPAIEYEKYSTYHQINDDQPYDYGGDHKIRNWNRQYQGWMSMRYALEQSLNVPAVKTFDEIGMDRGKEFAEGLGIEFDKDQLTIGEAIGGSSTNTTTVEMAGAYSAFGNEGIYTEPYTVTKVEFPDGSVVDLKPESEAAMSDYTAYMVTDMLKSVVQNGTGTLANIPELPVAGKTGTTNVAEKEGSNNSWFTGYTTNYTISIWTGYDDANKILSDTKVPHALFKETMRHISEGEETADFEKPDSVVEVNVEKGSNPPALASDNTPSGNAVTELFVKGTEPSKVSEKFEKIDPVSGLTAKYNEDKQEIEIDWSYDDDADVQFEVSYNVDGGDKKSATTTDDHSATISSVEEGKTYTVEVVAVDQESGAKSDPATASVETGDEEDEELPGVDNLSASYNESDSTIEATWNYDGPSASFEVKVNGNTETVDANSIKVSGATPGKTYTIQVTPVADDARGPTKETSITVEEENDGDNNDESDEDEEDEEEEDEETPPEDEEETPPDDNPEDEPETNSEA